MKVKNGDMVIVIAGKDKGAKGKVIAAYPRLNRVLVEGVNRIKKHTRVQTTQRGSKSGGIVTQEAPIHVSNVMVLDSEGQPTRVGYRVGDDGKKVLVPRESTISRVTVVIDKKGNIAYKASPAKAGEDSKKIEAVVKKLTD